MSLIRVCFELPDNRKLFVDGYIYERIVDLLYSLHKDGVLENAHKYYVIYEGTQVNNHLCFYDLQMNTMLGNYKIRLTMNINECKQGSKIQSPKKPLKPKIIKDKSISPNIISDNRHSSQKMVDQVEENKKIPQNVKIQTKQPQMKAKQSPKKPQQKQSPKKEVKKQDSQQFRLYIYFLNFQQEPRIIYKSKFQNLMTTSLSKILKDELTLNYKDFDIIINGQTLEGATTSSLSTIIGLFGSQADKNKIEVLIKMKQ